jgi:predicted XRE-type DNA-binding protein
VLGVLERERDNAIAGSPRAAHRGAATPVGHHTCEYMHKSRIEKKKAETVDAGSGDVLVDLGFADASERKLRVELAMRLNELIAVRRLTQVGAARLFGIPQPHVSELKHFKLRRFCSERLLRFVTLLDRDVEIVIRPKAQGRASGVVSVSVA